MGGKHIKSKEYCLTPETIVENKIRSVGGKAYALAQLKQLGFQVPDFCVLPESPSSPQQVQDIMNWWTQVGHSELAIRSSAEGEDSEDYSFAGQLSTYLQVNSPEGIKEATLKCFDSLHGTSSKSYQSHFQQAPQKMHVVLQKMVPASHAGVFFSCDPRGKRSDWVIEVVAGLGESLVSGTTDPYRVSPQERDPEAPDGWTEDMLEDVIRCGKKVKQALGYEVDMEWAFDQEGTLWLLQARPITTGTDEGNDQYQINRELNRLKSKHPQYTVWDGLTFAEFVGFPSYLTFSVWKQAFDNKGAFGKALKELGYLGFNKKLPSSKQPVLLERVFGRAYLNLTLLENLYFGHIPYQLNPNPRPHLQFSYKKINLKTILNAPKAWWQMLKVSWILQTSKHSILKKCDDALVAIQGDIEKLPQDHDAYRHWSNQELLDGLRTQIDKFTDEYLKWPFLLIILIESTTQSLLAILKRSMDRQQAEKLINRWMASGLATVSSKMDREFNEACKNHNLQYSFLEKYGHRGPGEMDLMNPRWCELKEKSFYKVKAAQGKSSSHSFSDVDAEISSKFSSLKASLIRPEWQTLKAMLELRERWKMSYMLAYGNIRNLALEIGQRYGLGQDIFWLRLSEIVKIDSLANGKEKVLQRKARFQSFRKVSLPIVVGLEQIDKILKAAPTDLEKGHTLEGVGLSPGISYGVVKIVQDPIAVDVSQWPDNVIVVAETTDPGWTPLFQHARGVIVERGGVLSHCAIVAREMGLPAVSRILSCVHKLKDGDYVWIDGTTGRVTRA